MSRGCFYFLGCFVISALSTPLSNRSEDPASYDRNSLDICLLQVHQGLGFEPAPKAADHVLGQEDNDLLTAQDRMQPPEPLLGLRVGTQAGLANVMKNGVLIGAFAEGGAAHAKFLSDQSASWFYPSYDAVAAYAPSRIDIADVTAESSDDSIVTVNVLRPIRRPGGRRSFSLVAGGESGVCQFAYVCHGVGEAVLRIEMRLRDPRRLSPVILLRKVCRALAIPGLAVGTALMKSSIVEDGSSKWTRDKSPVIAFESTELSVFATLMSPNLINQSFEAPRVHVVAQSQGLEHNNASSPNSHVISLNSHMGSSTHEPVLDVSLMSPWAKSGGTLTFGRLEEIALRFRCIHPGVALVELRLTPQPAWQPCKPVSVFMRKVCGGIRKHGLQVGTYAGGKDVVKDGIPQGNMQKVSLLERSSRFFIQYPSFEDGDPQLEPSPQVHCVVIGEPFGTPSPVDALLTVSAGKRNQQINVTYACKRAGSADCALDLGLRFWKPLVLHWHKSCGGPRPDAVIESDLPSFSEVFSVGRTAPAWTEIEPTVELPGEQSFASFIIRSNNSASPEDPEPLTLGRPIISVSNPKVLDVALLSETMLLGHEIRNSDSVAVTTRHLCKAHGDTVVHVKVPFLPHLPNGTSLLSADSNLMMQFDAAEFWYRKRCAPRQSYVAVMLGLCGALLFLLGFVGTTGFALSKSRQLNRTGGHRRVVVYGAAAHGGEDLQQL